VSHPVNGSFQLLVGVDRNVFHESLIRANGVKKMIAAIFCLFSTVDQILEDLLLERFTIGKMTFQFFLA
jgi:hypothetical protein